MSAHFSLVELTFSQMAVRLGIDNTPPDAIIGNLNRLCDVLEQIRTLVGRPVIVSSAYRAPALNAAIGGAANSAHLRGLAADIHCDGVTPKALAMLVRESGIAFDQLIFEGTWVHVGLAEGGEPRREVLTARFDGGKATYVRGIA